MIAAASLCGVDCVKFQKSSLRDKFNQRALDRPYGSVHSWGRTYGEHKEFLELSEDDYKMLYDHASNCGVDFSASAMDTKSLNFLHSLDIPFIKIGSGDAENWPLI